MSIRIRVYPQPNSVGARRNRAVRRQRQQIQRQQQQLQRLQLQQQMLRSGIYGGASFATPGFSNGFAGYGSSVYTPGASSWGMYGSPYAQPAAVYAPQLGAGSIYAGTSYLGSRACAPGSYSTTQVSAFPGGSPFGVAQLAARGLGWFGAW